MFCEKLEVQGNYDLDHTLGKLLSVWVCIIFCMIFGGITGWVSQLSQIFNVYAMPISRNKLYWLFYQ